MGALTSKFYAFKARPWELTKNETINIFESLCEEIVVENRGLEVVRILPKHNHQEISWISDKVRIVLDSFSFNRLESPQIFSFKENFVKVCSWTDVFFFLSIFFFTFFFSMENHSFIKKCDRFFFIKKKKRNFFLPYAFSFQYFRFLKYINFFQRFNFLNFRIFCNKKKFILQ